MITTTAPRRRAGQRISSALWGVLVMGAGALMLASFSGYAIDLELLAIILLASLGGWMLLSAALSGLGRTREVREATSPVEEEGYSDVEEQVQAALDEVDQAVTQATEPFRSAPADSAAPTDAPSGESAPDPVRSDDADGTSDTDEPFESERPSESGDSPRSAP